MVNQSYTGDVSPGGAPDVRPLGCLTLSKLAVDPEMSNNCYLLHCTETDEVVLIDAAAEPERLLELVGDRSLTYAQLDEQRRSLNARYEQSTDPAEALRLHNEMAALAGQLAEAEERWCQLQEDSEGNA